MRRRILFTIVFCLFFATTSSIECYTGTNTRCLLAPDMENCGSGEVCRCVKYRFKCTKDDQACSQREQATGVTKWAYSMISKNLCNRLENVLIGISNVQCCSTNRCNRPDNGKCSWSQARRRLLRKFTDILSFNDKY
ncbi:unnamed protein product [Rotaria sordida]|uniref:Uncharacterized protein n=1 Tax=Rotaria sordida TaxID=392033 RepID=A0A814XE88_9BILA|nr:unnamed protein product [Rotaria sordida]CAF3725058.1 unnamed protein product [Rotaria sordida]